MSPKWTLIRNPKAASGKCEKHWPRIQDILQKHEISYEERVTQHHRQAIDLAREAVEQGSRHLLAVGGDGTVNEVVNGLFTQEIIAPEEVRLAQIPVGTGNDWGRTIGIPPDYEKAAQVIQAGHTLLQDIGMVDFEEQGRPIRRYYMNIGGMGFDAFVGIKANERKEAGKGGVTGYISALVSSLMQYKSLPGRYLVDGEEKGKTKIFSLTVGICQYNGGGMKQCPDAIYDDGLLDLTLIRHLPKTKVIRNVPNLFNGKFVRNKEVSQYRGKEIRIEGPELLIEVDGENIGQGNATFRVEQKRLQVVAQKP